MTDPTADAIAALEPWAKLAEALDHDKAIPQPDNNRWTFGIGDFSVGDLRRAREVRSALLSAQGQAGKLVMTSLLVKLASIAVHAEEGLGPHAHPYDLDAVRSLLTDPEIRAFLDDPKNRAFLPLKRNPTEKDDGHGRG